MKASILLKISLYAGNNFWFCSRRVEVEEKNMGLKEVGNVFLPLSLSCLICSAMRCLEINQGCYNRCLTSHSAECWRFKQCWAWSQLVVALDPNSMIAPQGLLSVQWLLGDVIQADVQLANLLYSVVLSSVKTWETYFVGSSWRRNWGCGEKRLLIEAAKCSHMEFNVSPCPSRWSCTAEFTGSSSEFAAWSSLWNELCKTYPICLSYQKSYWVLIPQLSVFMDIWSLSG